MVYKFITTSNKKKSEYREPNENIKAINAENFYKKITGKKNVLKSIYQRIPDLIKKIDSKKENTIKQLLSEKEFNYTNLTTFIIVLLGFYFHNKIIEPRKKFFRIFIFYLIGLLQMIYL